MEAPGVRIMLSPARKSNALDRLWAVADLRWVKGRPLDRCDR